MGSGECGRLKPNMYFHRKERLFAPVLLGLICLLPSANAQDLNLEDFAIGNRLMLGNANVRIEPERETRVTAPAGGVLKLEVGQREGELPADTVLGVIDLDRLELETELHRLETAAAEAREIPEWRLEQQARKRSLRERLTGLERQMDLLDRLDADPEIANLYLSGSAESEADTDWGDDLTSRKERLGRNMELIRSVLDLIENDSIEERHFEIERLKRNQRALELERRRDLSTIQMPFDGRYRLLFPLVEGQLDYPVESGEEIVLFQDTRRFYAATAVQSSDWREHPKERLVLEISRNSGRSLEARFYSEREAFRGNQADLHYVFRFPRESSEAAEALAGGSMPAVLWVELGEVARMIPKMTLALSHPKLFTETTWTKGARELFPDARRVVAGATHVAVIAAD